MAKPNYNFEKRQRELKKAQKQEEKRLKKKLARTPSEDGTDQADPSAAQQEKPA